jgi:hypothetical protein
MLHRGPVVITSLEEDFKKIGLIAESAPARADENEEPGEEGEEGLDEAHRRIRKRTVAGGRKLATTKRTPVSTLMKHKRLYRKTKMKLKLKRKKKMRSSKFRKRAKILRKRAAARRHEGTNSAISNLIEEVADIVSSLDQPVTNDAIKSFANIAIISDLLANTFTEWSNDLDESVSDQETYDTLADAAESLADLAEAAAEIATALKEGNTIGEEEGELEALFKEYMEDLLEGMDLYNEAIDTMHGKAGNIGQPNAIGKKSERKMKKESAVSEDEDEDEDEDDDDEEPDEDDEKPASEKKKKKHEAAHEEPDGDEDEDGEEPDDDEDEEESKKKRPSKR